MPGSDVETRESDEVRAIFWGGRGRWGRGWGGPGYGPGGWYGPDKGPNGHGGRGGWEARAHETFDDWHSRAHGQAGTGPAPSNPGDTNPPAPPTQTGIA